MTRIVDHTDFANSFVALLPNFQTVRVQPNIFWNQLEVRIDRIVEESQDVELVEGRLSSRLGISMLQTLCLWLGLPAELNKTDLTGALSEQFANNPTSPWSQDILSLLDFVHNRRHSSIETISESLLPQETFDLIQHSEIDAHSKRFAYAMQVYYNEPLQLRLLMLFERGEAIGYSRYSLVPKAFEGEESIPEEAAEQAAERIQQGVDIQTIEVEKVNQALESFEARRGANRRSVCFGIHRDKVDETALIFILRDLREAYIREVDQTLFGDEAELVVLRVADRMRTIEEHSEKSIGPRIADALAAHLIGDSNIEYLEDQSRTDLEHLEHLIEILEKGRDDSLRLQEIYLRYAPIEQSPALILRCDKNTDLSAPLRFLRDNNIRLLEDLDNIRNISVVFERELPSGETQAYIFKLFFERVVPNQYFVRYSQRGVGAPMEFRGHFESYLKENYNVQAIPGTG
jgi:hypothetical protein